MAKNIVIVESPSKSRTIGKYLGKDYKVVASQGHIRDLATTGRYGLGVDVENNFETSYISIPGKKKIISDLKKEVKDADMIYLAADPDREGEAIAWHLKDTLGLKDNNYARVRFNEITHDKVIEAINNPSKIDDNLVKSQETRRVLDRIIGFRLSKLLQSKIDAKSAGRVQSVALKLIVDREREIEAFIPEEYWTITAHFSDLDADFFRYKDKDMKLKNEAEADKVLDGIDEKFVVESVEKKDKKRSSKPPFITSSLQQEASNKLGFSAKKTMQIAQKLYEGIDLGNERVGLITYMRTDSIRLSDDFIKAGFAHIKKEYGDNYVGYVKKSKKKENVQDAHEAIRPTYINRNPKSIKEYLDKDEFKLYSLIYARSIASLMSDAKLDSTTIIFNNNDYKFKCSGSVIIFDGYLKVYSDYESSEDKVLPDLSVGDVKETKDVEKEQHFTKPPARYTEAKLIKEMEELGIGRPSTYATIMDTIRTRKYVEMVDKKFKPTEMGFMSTDKLQEFFSDLINVEYTSNMENELDEIADGKIDYVSVLRKFYDLFEPRVKNAFKEMEKKPAEETGEMCPECGSPLVKRKGKYGEFVACSNYPTCKYIQKEEKHEEVIMDCPVCKKGQIVERKTRTGKIFWGCNNYPKCKTATWDKPTGEVCPECGKLIVETKDGEEKCMECDYTV